jgi:PKD repeat protein
VKNGSNCLDTTKQTATVYLTPDANFTVSKTEVCAGESLTINDLYLSHTDANDKVIASMDFGDTRKLIRQFGLKNGLRDTVLNYATFGNYSIKQVLKTSKLGCADSAQISVVVNSFPVVDVAASPLTVCANMQYVDFANNTINPDGKPITHSWLMGDKMGAFATASPRYSYGGYGKYTARYIASSRGCADTGYTQEVNVLPRVSASFGTLNFEKNNRLGTEFIAIDRLNVPMDRQFDWTFEKEGLPTERSTGVRVEKYFQYNGEYKVKLVAQNSIGCIDSMENTIDVNSSIFNTQPNSLNAYVFPNPTTNRTTYKFSAKKGDVVTVKMFTILGQQGLYERTWNVEEDGVYFDEIAMKRWNLSSGLYPLVIERGDQRLEVMMILIE